MTTTLTTVHEMTDIDAVWFLTGLGYSDSGASEIVDIMAAEGVTFTSESIRRWLRIQLSH